MQRFLRYQRQTGWRYPVFISGCGAEKPCTLLLYSDENIDWLTEDKAFYLKWGALLADVIAKGNKIKIIHTVNRDMSEMLAAIDRWLPLYMTGAIEPYYYPKYRENVFRRTMFIAPGVAALTLTTLSEQAKNAEHLFYVDRNMLVSLIDEFNAYLRMCRPLMRIFARNDPLGLSDLLTEFEEQSGDRFYLSNTLSAITMPEELFCRLLDLVAADEAVKEKMLFVQRARVRAFADNLQQHKHTEIIILPDFQEICAGHVQVKLSEFFSSTALYYTPADYVAHLKNIIHLLRDHRNFRFLIHRQGFPRDVHIAVKAEVGVFVAKSDTPPIVFAFNQQNMTNAFSGYFENIISKIPKKEQSKKHIIKKLLDITNNILPSL